MPLSEDTPDTRLLFKSAYLFCLISLNISVIVRESNTHLKRDFGKTSGTFDVETEDRQSHVQLILNSLFACIELLPLVDVLATCFTPENNQRGNANGSTVTGLIYRNKPAKIPALIHSQQ